MYNPSLIWLLPAGYQALKGKSMEVTRLPDITEEVASMYNSPLI